jgi:RNA polymerase sigma factor (sigma-70 family)
MSKYVVAYNEWAAEKQAQITGQPVEVFAVESNRVDTARFELGLLNTVTNNLLENQTLQAASEQRGLTGQQYFLEVFRTTADKEVMTVGSTPEQNLLFHDTLPGDEHLFWTLLDSYYTGLQIEIQDECQPGWENRVWENVANQVKLRCPNIARQAESLNNPDPKVFELLVAKWSTTAFTALWTFANNGETTQDWAKAQGKDISSWATYQPQSDGIKLYRSLFQRSVSNTAAQKSSRDIAAIITTVAATEVALNSGSEDKEKIEFTHAVIANPMSQLKETVKRQGEARITIGSQTKTYSPRTVLKTAAVEIASNVWNITRTGTKITAADYAQLITTIMDDAYNFYGRRSEMLNTHWRAYKEQLRQLVGPRISSDEELLATQIYKYISHGVDQTDSIVGLERVARTLAKSLQAEEDYSGSMLADAAEVSVDQVNWEMRKLLATAALINEKDAAALNIKVSNLGNGYLFVDAPNSISAKFKANLILRKLSAPEIYGINSFEAAGIKDYVRNGHVGSLRGIYERIALANGTSISEAIVDVLSTIKNEIPEEQMQGYTDFFLSIFSAEDNQVGNFDSLKRFDAAGDLNRSVFYRVLVIASVVYPEITSLYGINFSKELSTRHAALRAKTPMGTQAIFTSVRPLKEKLARRLENVEQKEGRESLTYMTINEMSYEISELEAEINDFRIKNLFTLTAEHQEQLNLINAEVDQIIGLGFGLKTPYLLEKSVHWDSCNEEQIAHLKGISKKLDNILIEVNKFSFRKAQILLSDKNADKTEVIFSSKYPDTARMRKPLDLQKEIFRIWMKLHGNQALGPAVISAAAYFRETVGTVDEDVLAQIATLRTTTYLLPLFRKLPALPDEDEPRATSFGYVREYLRRQLLKHYRREIEIGVSQYDDYVTEDSDDLTYADITPDLATDIDADTERNLLVSHAFEGLQDERTAEIIRLHYFEDYTYAELAKRFGISTTRIGQILTKGLELMKGKLKISADPSED